MLIKIVRELALFLAILFGLVTAAQAVGRSVAYGDISVYKKGQLVATLVGQNAVEDDTLLVCQSKCLIKSEGISLVGADRSKIAVKSENDTFRLYLKGGKVDFVINSIARPIQFVTPDGLYTLAEAVFNVNGVSVVKGTIQINQKGETEITVHEGRLVFNTSEGIKTVDPNNKIVLAVAPRKQGDDVINPNVVGVKDIAGGSSLSTGGTAAGAGGLGAVAGTGAIIGAGVGNQVSEDADTKEERSSIITTTPSASPSS